MSLKRKQSPELPAETESDPDLFWSSAIEDRSSRFIGVYSPTMKPEELQRLDEIGSASHKILAWRRESNQQSINKTKQYVTGLDDDGEKYGGKKVERVLQLTQVSGACVVARWYGGVLLGPIRFAHIESCAKEAIQCWRERESERRQKKMKIEQDAAETQALAKALAERDQSIAVLRALASENEELIKQARNSAHDSGTVVSGAASSHKAESSTPQNKTAAEYGSLSLDRLRALDKARDATLSFLLKRIDKAETELASL